MAGTLLGVNTTIRIVGSASGGGTLGSNEMAACFYTVTSQSGIPASGSDTNFVCPNPVLRIVGPSQTVPSTFTSQQYFKNGTSTVTITITYTLQSGVVLRNSP